MEKHRPVSARLRLAEVATPALRCFQTSRSIRRKSCHLLDISSCFLFPPGVQTMPNMIVACAKRGQGHLSFWCAIRATGIVKDNF